MREIKIGQVIKRVLKTKHQKLKDVSRETGVPYSTLHTWQENRQPKDILKVQQLADYFGITLHELLFDESDGRTQSFGDQVPNDAREFFKGVFEITVKKVE